MKTKSPSELLNAVAECCASNTGRHCSAIGAGVVYCRLCGCTADIPEASPKPKAITASTSARSNGWAAVLEFPNGGRQLFPSRYTSHDAALNAATHALRNRLAYPEACIPDPDAHTLQIVPPAIAEA